MARLDEQLSAPVGSLAEPLEYLGSLERETGLGDLVADAFREAAGADIALVLGSSLRAPLPAGPLTRRHAMAVLPFGNRVVAVELDGASVRAALERALSSVGKRTGASSRSPGSPSRPTWRLPRGGGSSRSPSGGVPLRDDALYRVAVSSHLASGGDGHAEIAGGRRLPGAAPLDADALGAHLGRASSGGPAPAPEAGRIRLRASR